MLLEKANAAILYQTASICAARAALGDGAEAEALVVREPALLGADVGALLSEVRAVLCERNTEGVEWEGSWI